MEKIAKLECLDAKVPLPEPIKVGSATISYRTYTIVKITTESGIEGIGYCYSRGLPISKIIEEMLLPIVVGADLNLPEKIRQEMLATYWHSGEHGIFTAAISAIDIALWDGLGKASNSSVARLLGQVKSSLQICTVIGYKYGEDETELISEIEYAQQKGITSFKMVVGADTWQRDANRAKLVRELIGPTGKLAVDAFRSFKDLDDGIRRVKALMPYDLSFVEDPFLESQGILAARLRERTGALIAFGESQFGHRGIAQLVLQDYVDVVRLDSLLIGGVKEFLLGAAIASAKGLTVATHIHSEIHAQLAATINNLYTGGLEYLDPKFQVDLFHELILNPLEVKNGEIEVSAAPGFGIQWDWEAIFSFK